MATGWLNDMKMKRVLSVVLLCLVPPCLNQLLGAVDPSALLRLLQPPRQQREMGIDRTLAMMLDKYIPIYCSN
jgi:hypothetical protein